MYAAGIAAVSLEDSTPATVQDSSDQGTDLGKKIRNLQKKLKQIQQLKDKRESAGISSLTHEQLQKLESEQSVLSELYQLQH